jgi:phosphatidyl-myo-inositol dimannoside synthase
VSILAADKLVRSRMPKVLIVTNDFPPRTGGIQSFVHALAVRLQPERVLVYAPKWVGAEAFDKQQPFPVTRHSTSLMLPFPSVRDRATELLTSHGCDTVLFGAAAPLGLLAPALRKAGALRIVGVTHGHEAGWAAIPAARGLLRRIGDAVDALTYLGEYFRVRIARALSPVAAARMVQLTPGVDTGTFRRGAGGAAIRARNGLADRPVVVCVSRLVTRKGQDTLIRAWPQVRAAGGASPILLLVGSGPVESRLRHLACQLGVAQSIVFAGHVPEQDLPAYYDAGNVFAMPCRTLKAGLDVEGIGIVYLEAAATGLPVIAGNSGGAPDAVMNGETGYVVPGGDVEALAERLNLLLCNPATARAMGEKGRAWMERQWRWDLVARRLEQILTG